MLFRSGGGGLLAGCALALADAAPKALVYAAEPADFNDTARSLAAGERLANAPGGKTICDAIVTPTPGRITFEINRKLVAGGLVASDAEVGRAMRLAFEHLRIVIEPGGAIALACVLAGRIDAVGKVIAVVASGGNVDADLFARMLGPADGTA